MSDVVRPGENGPQTMGIARRILWLIIWLFPYFLAGFAYLASKFYPPAASLGLPVLQFPIPADVYLWLLIMVIAAGIWLVGEFISVTGRETVVSTLQLDAVFSSMTAIIFTGFAGYFIGTDQLQWWYVVPWIVTIIDALTAAMLSVNNAAQKPFLSKRGTI